MPVAINIAANLILGGAIAWTARRSETLQESWLNWSTLLLCSFEALLVTPATTYLFRFYPHWSTFYLFDPREFPAIEDWLGWLSVVVMSLNFLAAIVGYLMTRHGILKESLFHMLLPILLGALTIAVLTTILYERVFFIGGYDTFWEGDSAILMSQAPGIVGTLLYLVAAGFVAWVHVRFGEQEPKFF